MIRQYFYLFLVLPIFLFGCGQQEENNIAEQGEQNQTLQVKNSDPIEREDFSNQQIAQHLANLANDVPSVNNATAVVAGPYAAVGIDVDKDLDRSRVGTIKYAVTEALQHDPYGKTAIVVADADGAERIRDMANKVEQGHPVQGIVDELAAIVGRYMPEFPISDNQPEEQDENKNVIPKEEEQELENVEEEQSNHHKDN
ncbi:YhcN/YlaJ family sporulation lipoprotein [Aquibacillus rhizosphaerae]|uniref:YhcN/YlaJ family sporulation lipoprotein n=1 Tax=Aquibacillus rhizosphaerae TaxID=3051431 RepID=A0ABT7L618_9BACI|nr:YhcN/YlaJ family sporulation lipoprotein [Aquibacillus sp. LR5S19]MDL4841306.1 YhcN/YlaJ family sporulation lipoprotein [Aquibacillus sp. LR5S19]